MNKTISSLIAKIGGSIFQQIAKEKQESRKSPQQKSYEEELRRQQFIQKVNYYNYLSIFYFIKLNRIKNFLISTLLLDYLLLFAPRLSHEIFAPLNFNLIFDYCTYLLVFLACWEIFGRRSPQSKNTLIGPKAFLVIILILMIFFGTYQILYLEPGSGSFGKIWVKLLFLGIAISPLLSGMFKANKNPYKPQMGNFLIILNFAIPIILLRISHLIATFTIYMLGTRYLDYSLYSLAVITTLVLIKPLIDRFRAPPKRRY